MGVTAVLADADVTELVQRGSVTHRWGMQLDEASVVIDSDYASAAENDVLDIYLDGNLDFSARVAVVEDQGGVDEMQTMYTAVAPWFIYDWRPARDLDGDFSDPSFLQDFQFGPQIFEAIHAHSVIHEGAMGVTIGSVASGSADLTGSPTNWPMSLAEVGARLISTGLLDIVHVPQAGGTARADLYNGDYGSDLSGSVVFQYAMGSSSNCSACRRTVDTREIMNKKWDYLGPRKNQQQWWGGNITGDHPDLAALPGNAAVMAAISISRSAYYERFQFETFEQFSNIEEAEFSKPFYLRRWLAESYLRAGPKVLTEFTPDPGISPAFGVGDKIGVIAGSTFRGGFSGAQRVMEYTYGWDTEGVVQLGAPIGKPGMPPVTTTTSAENPT